MQSAMMMTTKQLNFVTTGKDDEVESVACITEETATMPSAMTMSSE